MLDPNNPNRLLGGAQFLWRTNDARAALTPTTGPTWETIKDPNANDLPPGLIWPINTIAVAEGNPDIIWIGYNNGDVYFTTNGTAAVPIWTKVDDNATPLPARTVLDIGSIREPQHRICDPQRVQQRQRLADDKQWRFVGRSVRHPPRCACAIPPGSPEQLELALRWDGDRGVHEHRRGCELDDPQDGPANVSVAELFWVDTTLVAATHGRGMFTTQTSTVTMSLTPAAM
jgi:hypothetical protein